MNPRLKPMIPAKTRKPFSQKNFYGKKSSTLKNASISIIIWVMLSMGFWHALTTTLHDMTLRNCLYGIQKACDALNK